MGLTFIVRRGALRRFHRLKQATTNLPVDVMWDRRTPNHRTTAAGPNQIKHALTDRRQQPPFTWTAADFALIEEEDQ